VNQLKAAIDKPPLGAEEHADEKKLEFGDLQHAVETLIESGWVKGDAIAEWTECVTRTIDLWPRAKRRPFAEGENGQRVPKPSSDFGAHGVEC
jgi:hypothetical protein